MLIRRQDDDGVSLNPFGSSDEAPIIGRLGTGVELNELFTCFSQGGLRETGSDFDFALDGKGFFVVSTPRGDRFTRNGSFVLGPEGMLVNRDGFPVLGENGPVRINHNNFQVDRDGRVWVNAAYEEGPETTVGRETNTWEETVLLDTLRLVEFDLDRYLQKQGASLFRESETSGPAMIIPQGRRPQVFQGFLESSNVDPIMEMVKMIEINRAYEANQRVIQAGESTLGVLINQVTRFQ